MANHDFKDLWKKVILWNDFYFPDRQQTLTLKDYALGLAGEIGELCNAVKHWYGDGTNVSNEHPIQIKSLGLEAVDIYIYLVLLCESIGIGPQQFNCFFDLKLAEITQRMEYVREMNEDKSK